jgi:outer membrane protein assembly factor BamE
MKPESSRRPTVLALVGCAAVASLVAGCSSTPPAPQDANRLFGIITPYRMEIVQGNAVTSDQVGRLRPGMPRDQVLEVLGTPLVASLFHAERWDYVFLIRRRGAEPQRRSVVVWFKDDRLDRVEAPDDLPSEREFVADISNVRPRSVPVLALTPEQRAALPVPARPPAPPAAEPMGPVREYPPLEP